MKEDQLKLLENRINSAIAFIENLKSREKKLLSEREDLRNRILFLEKGIEEKERRNEDLIKTQKYLKEKIEFILGKLEGLAEVSGTASGVEFDDSAAESAKSEDQPPRAQTSVKERPRGPRAGADGPGSRSGAGARETGGIIIEERIVDLKEENEKNRPKNAVRGGQPGTQTNVVRREEDLDGYAADLFSNEGDSMREERRGGDAAAGWHDDNLFVEA